MKTEVKTISPAWARDRLEELQKAQESGSFRQRAPRQRAIQRYAADMLAGKWLVTHQGIAFDVDGNLIDGQNRLWAVVRANIPVKMAVTTGVEGDGKLEAMDVIDAGMTRSLGDQLRISHDFAYANEAAALTRGVVLLVSHSWLAKPSADRSKSGYQISAQEALFILNDLGFSKALERAITITEKSRMRHRAVIAPWTWYWQAHPQKAEEFLTGYTTLENQSKGAPALLLSRGVSGWGVRRKVDKEWQSVTAKALQAYDQGEILGNLKPNKEALNWLVGLDEKLATRVLSRVCV